MSVKEAAHTSELTAAEPRRWLTVDEVAQRLCVNHRAVRRAIDRGELRASKVCSRIRIDLTDFDEWIISSRVEPSARPSPEDVLRSTRASTGLRPLLDKPAPQP